MSERDADLGLAPAEIARRYAEAGSDSLRADVPSRAAGHLPSAPIRQRYAQLCFAMLAFVAASLPAAAQGNPPQPGTTAPSGAIERLPSVTSPEGIRMTFPYRAPAVSPSSTVNSRRTYELIRAGNLYLSLQDAIALALENNLDVEVARYGPLMAKTEIERAKGGGQLRGLTYTVRELPPGEGGPAGPLLTALGASALPTALTSNFGDASLVTGSTTEFSVLNPLPLSTGSSIPQYDPSWTTNLSWNHTSTPELFFDNYGVFNYTANATSGGTALSQGFSTGATASLSYTSARTSSDSTTQGYNPYSTAALGITITQPLLQGFGIDLNRRFIQIAKNEQKLATQTFRLQLVATVYSVIRLYWDLVSLQADVGVKKEAQAAAQKLYDDNRSQVEVGTLAPLQLKRAQAEVARTKQDLITSQGLADQQEALLKNILTRSGNEDPLLIATHIVPLDHLEVPKDEVLPPLDELVNFALKTRPDLDQERIQLENVNLSLKGSKNELLPQLDIVASATNNAFAGQLNSIPEVNLGFPSPRLTDPALLGGAGTLFSQLFQRNYPNYGIGFQLTIPIRNRIAQADVIRDELQMRQTQARLKQNINQVRVEVENARLAVERGRAAYDAAVETRSLQEDALDAEQQRLAVGQSTTFAVIQIERDLAQARSTELVAAGNYLKAKAALDRAMGRTLLMNNVKYAEGLNGIVPTPPSALPAGK
jgi:outer membrane protein TolC